MRAEFLAYFAGYIALVLAAGLAFSRKTKSLEDFFLASRDLPGGLIFLALTSSWFGATSLLVSTDRALADGISAFWIMGVPAVGTILVLALVIARPLRRFEIMSLPDLVELRYGRLVRHLAAALIILYMIMLAASQLVALGQFLKTFLGLPYIGSLAAGAAVVLVYSAFGGLRSVVFTDVVKFPLLVIGVGGLALFVAGRLSAAGGLGAALSSPPASALEPTGYFDFFHNVRENALVAVSFILAWTISPIALQRIQAARSLGAARRGLFSAAAALFGLYGLVVFIGILSARLFSGAPLSGPLVSEIIATKAGPVFGGILFVAVLSAILSTMDTAVNTGALSQQAVPFARTRPVLAGRLATVLVAVLAFVVAARLQNILKTIGLSSEIMAEGLFVPGMAMIFFKRRVPLAGLLSLGLGGGFAVLSFLGAAGVLSLGLPAWPFSVPYGVGLSLAGYAVGYGLERRKR
jgi:SSS family solute:Na+ symporter